MSRGSTQVLGLPMLPSATILAIGSDPAKHRWLAEELTPRGHMLVTVADGRDGLERARTMSFDLAFIDATVSSVPPTEEVIARLKQEDVFSGIPVLVLSGLDAHDRISRCMQAGADDHVSFDPEQLHLRVRLWMEHKRLNRTVEADVRKLAKLADDLKRVVLPLGIALTEEHDHTRLLERILLEARKLCNADGGTLYRRTPDDRLHFTILFTESLGVSLGGTSGKPIPFAPLSLRDAAGAPNLRNLATRVALEGQTINIPDTYQSDAFDFSATREFDRQNAYRSISILTAPLKRGEEVVGVLQLLNARDPMTGDVIEFDSFQQLLVDSLAAQAAVALNSQALIDRQEELLKIERDVQIGHQIQKSFLPDSLPEVDGWEIAARFEPARVVAGDFYDAFELGPQRIAFLVADVCDKGVGAALFMALVRSLIRAFAQHQSSFLCVPRQTSSSPPPPLGAPNTLKHSVGTMSMKNAVSLANQYIMSCHAETAMFATLFFGVLNPETGAVKYINAGHNPPIVRRANGEIERLPPTGPAVGMIAETNFKMEVVTLAPGDALLAFTDGITDARDLQGKLFSDKRLVALVNEPPGSASALLERIESAVRHFVAGGIAFDDITMLALHRKGDGAIAAPAARR